MSPCGGSIAGIPSKKYEGGEIMFIEWTEKICRPGSPFRIAISRGKESSDEFNDNVIIDHIPQNTNCSSNQKYSYTIRVPKINCEKCIIQVSQIVTESMPYNCPSDTPEDWNSFYACADISISYSNDTNEVEDQSPDIFPDSGNDYGIESASYVNGTIVGLKYFRRPECYWDCSKNENDPKYDEDCVDDGLNWGYFCNDMVEPGDRIYCVKWKTFPETIYWIMEAKTKGWAALGLSENKGMTNSDHYVMWYDESNNRVNLLGRYSPGKSREPRTDEEQNSVAKSTSLLERGDMITDGPIMRASFARQYSTGDPHDLTILPNREIYLLWALHESNSNYDVKHTHKIKMGIRIDFFDTTNPFDKFENVRNLMLDHGILMFISWGVFAIAGHMVARYKRDWKNWFVIHVALMIFAAFFNLVAFSIIIFAINQSSSPHFSGVHQIIGLIVFIFSLSQPILGLVAYCLYDSNRTRVPIWPDKIHMWNGRIGLFISMVNILIGVIYFRSHPAIIAAYCIYLVALVVFVVVMEWKVRKDEKKHVTRYGELEEVEKYKKFEDFNDYLEATKDNKEKGKEKETQII